jgi:hypothetical protein
VPNRERFGNQAAAGCECRTLLANCATISASGAIQKLMTAKLQKHASGTLAQDAIGLNYF